MSAFLDLFFNIDTQLAGIITHYGTFTYVLLFIVIFCETGLVVTPFLPGDALLFAAGAFAAGGSLNLTFLCIILIIAAILGDSINYLVGHEIGTRIYDRNLKLIKREYIDRTQTFYARHGGKTIILARFLPIIRTFAPFVAGAGKMQYSAFILYNIVGGIVWVMLFTFAGYFFGTIPIVARNFEFVIIGIMVISTTPVIFEWLKSRRSRASAPQPASPAPPAPDS